MDEAGPEVDWVAGRFVSYLDASGNEGPLARH